MLLGSKHNCSVRWGPWTCDSDAREGEAAMGGCGGPHVAPGSAGHWIPGGLATGGGEVSAVGDVRRLAVPCGVNGAIDDMHGEIRLPRRPMARAARRGPRPTLALLAAVTLATHGIGQAVNPGPGGDGYEAEELRMKDAEWRSFVDYPEPHRDGFRDIATPGFGDDPGPGRRPPEEEFRLEIECVNSTGWGPLSRRLASTSAHAIVAQETWVLMDQVAGVSDWARRHGWEAVIAPAVLGPGGGGERRSGRLCQGWDGTAVPSGWPAHLGRGSGGGGLHRAARAQAHLAGEPLPSRRKGRWRRKQSHDGEGGRVC